MFRDFCIFLNISWQVNFVPRYQIWFTCKCYHRAQVNKASCLVVFWLSLMNFHHSHMADLPQETSSFIKMLLLSARSKMQEIRGWVGGRVWLIRWASYVSGHMWAEASLHVSLSNLPMWEDASFAVRMWAEASFTCKQKQASHMSRKVCWNKMSNHMFQQMSSSFDRK